MIRKAKTEDYKEISTLLKTFYPKHNIFSQELEIIETYIATQVDTLLINITDGKITGVTYVVQTGMNAAQNHKIWKFRHFAYSDEAAGVSLLTEAENHIKAQSETVKIELTIAETENAAEFYENNGYVKEATLTNHYRWGESCYIYAKSFGSD